MKTLIVKIIPENVTSQEIIKYFNSYDSEIEEKFKKFDYFILGQVDYSKLSHRSNNDIFQVTTYFRIVKLIDEQAIEVFKNLRNDGTIILDENAIENVKANIGKLGFLDYL